MKDAQGQEKPIPEYTGTSLELREYGNRIRPESVKGDLFDAATHTLSWVPYLITQAPYLLTRILFALKGSKQDHNYHDRGDLG